MPHAVGGLLIPVIPQKYAAGWLGIGADHDLAVDTVFHRIAVCVHQVDAVAGHRLTHSAGLEHGAKEVGNTQGHLRLAEALGDLQAGSLLELIEHLRVQRLAGGGGVVDGAEVVAAQILLNEHPVHGRRRAEGGDIVLGEHGKDLLRIEPVKVIDKYRALAQPLAVELTPERLAPAGLGDGEMQSVPLHQMPVLGSGVMTQSVFIGVHCHLGIAGRAGSKEHDHRIAAAGGIFLPGIAAAEQAVFLIEIMPALPAAAHQHLGQLHAGGLFSQLDLVGGIAVGGAKHRAHARSLKPVGKVMLHQLIGGRDGDGA